MKLFAALILTIGSIAYAHDEGHGPKVADAGKYGGLVSAVVAKADASKHAKADLVHKAELVRSSGGEMKVYVYDATMKPLDLKDFEKNGEAILAFKEKKKWKNEKFKLELKENAFVGKMPMPKSKPYNIDVFLKQGSKDLLSAFDNLD